MNRVVTILMERDGMNEADAIELVKETKEELLNSGTFFPDDIIWNNLGLEPDYLIDILGY